MRRKIPSTQSLICFEAAARHESYTRAAQELALTQSAVSRRITALEDFLGLALFHRTRHGVALTPAGANYVHQITRLLDTMERDTFDAMARQNHGGSLQLAAVPTFATRWLIPRLPDFAAKHPDITVHIETCTQPFLFNATPFDAALYTSTAVQAANWAGTRSTALLDEDLVPVCSPALLAGRKALAPATIARMPLLQQSTRPDGWRQWFDAQNVDAPRPHSGPRYDLFTMIASAAAHGLGVALMPALMIQSELARGELVIACNRSLRGRRSYYLVTPADGEERLTLKVFRTWLLAQASTADQSISSATRRHPRTRTP